MNKQKKRTAWFVAFLAVVVMLALILVYHIIFHKDQATIIALPDPVVTVQAEQLPASSQEDLFIDLGPENLQGFLSAIQAAESFSCTYTTTLTTISGKRIRTIQIWKKQDQLRAVISDGQTIRNLLLCDHVLWLWYNSDMRVVEIANPSVDFLDFCGIPTVQRFLDDWSGYITDCSYETAVSGESILLVTGCNNTEGQTCQISLDTGMLLQTSKWDESGTFYEVMQTDYQILTPADEDYQSAFDLPDK